MDQASFLEGFKAASSLKAKQSPLNSFLASTTYSPPMALAEVMKKYPHLLKDPVHKWRAESGIELIHQEPSLEELQRIRKNWDLMSSEQKAVSEAKAKEMFGVDNNTHYQNLLPLYKSNKEIFDTLKSKGIRYAIGGSYGMRHLREPEDLDILTHKDDWKKLISSGLGKEVKAQSGGDSYAINAGKKMEFFPASYPKGFAYHELKDYDKDEYGNECWNLAHTKAWKEAFNRPKDKEDLKLINGALSKQAVEMSFPKSEIEALKSRLKNNKSIFTTRVDNEYNKYVTVDEVSSILGKLKIKGQNTFTDLNKHPFKLELTPNQLKELQKYNKFNLIELTKQAKAINTLSPDLKDIVISHDDHPYKKRLNRMRYDVHDASGKNISSLEHFPFPDPKNGYEQFVDSAYTLPSHQGLGLGTMLFKQMEKDFPKVTFRLCPRPFKNKALNQEALTEWYKRLGYKKENKNYLIKYPTELNKEAKSAVGIKDRGYFGRLDKGIAAGDIVDYMRQDHRAFKAGPHFDFRFGKKSTGLHSFHTRQDYPAPGTRTQLGHSPVHTYDYLGWSGDIPKGQYGGGRVDVKDQGKILITGIKPNEVHFTIATEAENKRYALVQIGDDKSKRWELIRANLPQKVDAEKPKFKLVPHNEIDKHVEGLSEEAIGTPKVDGALNYVTLNRGKVDLISHRISKKTKAPILHTERFFGDRPKIELPKEWNNSVLLSEIYGEKNNIAVPCQAVSGILNSNIFTSLDKQKSEGITLKAMLFDIAKKNGQKIELPYSERLELLKDIHKHLPKDKFTLPEVAKGPVEIKALLDKIRSGKYPTTEEGIITHDKGKSHKVKLVDEEDVFIKSFEPAEKGSKYEGKAIGSINYSLTEDGNAVGRIGSGLDDSLRKLMFEQPNDFIGRIARIKHQGQYDKTKAYRMPVLLNIHEG